MLNSFMILFCCLPLQFEYAEGEIALRFLRLKYAHVRQNITYDCEGGMDGFMLVQLLGANGNTLTFHDKTVRLVSEVCRIHVIVILLLVWIKHIYDFVSNSLTE